MTSLMITDIRKSGCDRVFDLITAVFLYINIKILMNLTTVLLLYLRIFTRLQSTTILIC